MATAYDSEPFDGPSTLRAPPSGHRRAASVHTTPPNPSFSFPAQPYSPAPTASTMTTDDGSSRSPAMESDGQSFPDSPPTDDQGPAALPAFSFNPGAALPPDPNGLLSPPMSPGSSRPMPSPSRPARHGHRRGGSEFVGGSIRDGNSIAIISTSPTKESAFSTQSLLPPPPRRGHRRGVSGTISTNDLPILQPPIMSWEPKGNSAPNSPTNFDQGISATIPLPSEPSALLSLIDPAPLQPLVAEPVSRMASDVLPIDEPMENPKPQKSGNRARVGFSDTLEFIPRPLSLVSSDTSSTVTARPAHSVSGSISSVVSPTSPLEHESFAPISRSSTREPNDSRPSTAGAILDRVTAAPDANKPRSSPKRRNSIPTLVGIADTSNISPPCPSPTKSSKRWSFFGLDPFVSNGIPAKGRPISSSSSDSAQRSSDVGSDGEVTEWSTDRKKASRRSKMKGMRGWAGAILPLKSKSDRKRSKPNPIRPPTPPASITTPLDDEDEESDNDTTQPEQPATPTISISTPPTPSKPRAEDVSYQMIDLDAALGPFNTPLPHNPEWEAAQRAAGNVGKRRLHSAQGMKGFSGPGMHYHRRAESAPDLPPFDPGRAGIHRFGSNSTMADVFEEEEEEEAVTDGGDNTDSLQIDNTDDQSDNEATPPAAAPKDISFVVPQNASHTVRRTSSGLSDKDQAGARSLRGECSRTSLHENVIMEEPIWPPHSRSFAQNSRDSLDSGAPSPRKLSRAYDQTILHAPPAASSSSTAPLSPYSMTNASSHPSPRSPMSVDAHRISTAPSSVADDNCFQSLLMGEPGPEVRISMDYDIPSLTSSTSATTRESSFVPTARPYPSPFRDQRPSSVSSAAFGRRRSSLISLSRLISSSHGERSKLSTELTPEGDANGGSPRKSKKKRLGRMMQFWRPNKEESTT